MRALDSFRILEHTSSFLPSPTSYTFYVLLEMMALIQDLPYELVLLIVDHLTPVSLLNVNLTSRHFYNLTIAPIYSCFDGPSLSKFLRTIASPAVSSCKLSRYVKKVSWDASASKAHANRGVHSGDKNAIAMAYQSLCLALPDEKSMPLDRYFAQNFRGSIAPQAWFLEFVLSFLPSVSEVDVHDVWQWTDYKYWSVIIPGQQ